jgi:hypothetical protein
MRWRTAWFAVCLILAVGSIKLPHGDARIAVIAKNFHAAAARFISISF